MFSPLSVRRNRISEIDRFDSTVYPDNTSQKYCGYSYESSGVYNFLSQSTGSLVVQCWPNSDDLRVSTSGANREKWMFFNITNNSTSTRTWWSPCITTADDATIGPASDYPTLFPNGTCEKGTLMIPARVKSGEDGIWLINTGSIYNWNDPQPISIAFSQDGTTGLKCSINGETATIDFEARVGKSADDTDWFDTLSTGASSEWIGFGWDKYHFNQIAQSGSFHEFAYYTASLTQDELNVISGQPWGQTTNVLEKQPQYFFKFEQDNKVAKSGSLESYEIGNASFDNLAEGLVSRIQFTTATGGQTNLATSGSVIDSTIQEYRERI